MTSPKPRTTADWKAEPISDALFAELRAALAEKVGADRLRPALLINAGGIEKVIDNAADARETIRRIAESRQAAPAPAPAPPPAKPARPPYDGPPCPNETNPNCACQECRWVAEGAA